jgi:hypothetical protein
MAGEAKSVMAAAGGKVAGDVAQPAALLSCYNH